MKQRVGPYQIEMEKMGFRDDETNIWWPKFKCPKCGKKFYAFLEEILLGDIYLCPKCGKYPVHLLEQKEDEQRRKRAIKKDAIQKGITIGKEQKEFNKKIREINAQRKKEFSFCSKGEEKVGKILQKHNISFVSQCRFKDCINFETGKQLPFDFYLPDYNCCIEFDGKQHYAETEYFKDDLENIRHRDLIKDKYCKDNNIKLIRIRYDCKDIEKYILQRL